VCRAQGVPFVRVALSVGKALSQSVTPQGAVAVVRSPAMSVEDIPEAADLVLVLAEVRDPGNAGTLIRSAAAAGAGGVVFSARSVDALGPKTVRSAAGAVFRIPLVLDVQLHEALSTLRSRDFVILGTDPRAQLAPDACDMTGKSVLVLGNEAWGLPPGMEDLIDEVIGIPMPGSTESLNVAAAGSILLFEAVRQRRSGSRLRR
jgi:RNA methyltransferase, TrmH family